MATRTNAPVSLEPGDHLTREEFHRRYLARPDIKKAELIDGVVYMPSPVRLDQHGEPHGFVMAWLGVYVSQAPGVRLGDNTTVYLDGTAEVQPDAFVIRPRPGGPRVTDDGYVEACAHAPRIP